MCEECGAYVSQDKLIECCLTDLQELYRKYQLDLNNYYDDKSSLEKNKCSQKKLIEKHKQGLMNFDDFWEIYTNYQENIDSLEEKINEIQRKIKNFQKLSIQSQKDIVRKYVSRIEISNFRKRKKTFNAKVIFVEDYQ